MGRRGVRESGDESFQVDVSNSPILLFSHSFILPFFYSPILLFSGA
jgi:hypothetical protein